MRTITSGKRTRRLVLGACAVATLVLPVVDAAGVGATAGASPAGGAPAVAPAALPAPTPTPAKAGKPTSVAAIGDSITQSTGTGALSAENPKNSWATGWEVNSVAARAGVPTNKRYNYSANGNTMSDFVSEVRNGKSGGSGDVAPMPADTGLVLVEMGGNDLCKSSVDSMTSVASYRSQFKAGLAEVAARAPEALIQVMSVPDIYNLWYIRGGVEDSVYHPEPESDQANGLNGSRFYWDGLTSIGVKFPCQSLLANPTSYAAADRQRREAVRTRNKEYNKVLSEECALVLRCKFDSSALFNFTSNRKVIPDGPLLPQDQWKFVDLDISRNTASLCPIPGLVGGGCGDHFHPSKQGQGKIAEAAWNAGRNYADTQFPIAIASVVPSGRPDGLNHGRAVVHFLGADESGLRGQEVRLHDPDGSVGPWVQHRGMAPDLVVTKLGTSYAEVRSLDNNGNLSASTVIPVVVDAPAAPLAPLPPTVTADAAGLRVTWLPPDDDGGAGVTGYQLASAQGIPPTTIGAPVAVGNALTAIAPPPPPGSLVRFAISATNPLGTSSPSSLSAPTIAPFASLATFVDQQYRDFTGRAPTAAESAADVAGLTSGALTPSGLIERLRAGTWFDGAYGPAIRLYRAYFLRDPDPSGLDYWASKRRAGRTLDTISQQFSVSSEFVRRYGSLTDAAFIDKIYVNVFGRAPDPSGRDFYLRRLAAGWSRGKVVLQFSESSEYKRLSAGRVAVVELNRGMNGKAPLAAAVASGLTAYGAGGAEGVFTSLVGTTAYRTRVHA